MFTYKDLLEVGEGGWVKEGGGEDGGCSADYWKYTPGSSSSNLIL